MLQRSRSFHVSNRKEKKEFVPSPQIPLEPTVIERSSLIPYSNSPFPAKTLNDINLNHFGESAKNLSKLIFDLETNSQSRHDVIGLAQITTTTTTQPTSSVRLTFAPTTSTTTSAPTTSAASSNTTHFTTTAPGAKNIKLLLP